jgi:D-glycero-D-manno-heptose 1,7-bisphosphate phosphatase
MRKVVFLDRDGTLNVDKGFVYSVDSWQWIEGALEALQRLRDCGFALAVVTNQSGIGHGLYTLEDMKILHAHMQKDLTNAHVRDVVLAYCPHRRDGACDCRKPLPGMAREVEHALGEVDYKNSWTVGDKLADIGFGKALGTRTILLESRYWSLVPQAIQPDGIMPSLKEAAKIICSA